MWYFLFKLSKIDIGVMPTYAFAQVKMPTLYYFLILKNVYTMNGFLVNKTFKYKK